jgi:hypothetical protein
MTKEIFYGGMYFFPTSIPSVFRKLGVKRYKKINADSKKWLQLQQDPKAANRCRFPNTSPEPDIKYRRPNPHRLLCPMFPCME